MKTSNVIPAETSAPAVDSHSAADALYAADWPYTSETVRQNCLETVGNTAPLLREVDADEMFGTGSVLEVPAAVPQNAASVTDSVLFQLMAVLLFVLLCVSYGRDVLRNTNRTRRRNDKTLAANLGGGDRPKSVNSSVVTGLLLMVCIGVKYSGWWLPEALRGDGMTTVLYAAGLTFAAAVVCACYQALLLYGACAVTRRHDFAEELFAIKKSFFSLTALTVSPLFLMSALSHSEWWTTVLAVECCILTLVFIKETITFFISKKVPILLWFLYLCTAEAFPFTLAVALIARYR